MRIYFLTYILKIGYDFAMKNPTHILITGASSGIGKALSFHYAKKGVHLYLTGRDEGRLKQVVKACEEKGAVALYRAIDVTNRNAMAAWIDEIDVLELVIANAGISGGTNGRQFGEPIQEARDIFNVNLYGVLNTMEPAIKKMENSSQSGEKSQIAIISSLAGFRGWPSSPAYSASKGAVRFYGEAMRGAMRDSGIDINVVFPGFITTPMTDVNDFPMPFKMAPEKAAKIIADGLEKNKGRICFPWPMHFIVWLIGILPDFLAQRLLSAAPHKSAFHDVKGDK